MLIFSLAFLNTVPYDYARVRVPVSVLLKDLQPTFSNNNKQTIDYFKWEVCGTGTLVKLGLNYSRMQGGH
jgi:hypothetical protein